MQTLTSEEQSFVDTSRETVRSGRWHVRMSVMAFLAVLLGAVAIVTPDAVALLRSEQTPADFAKTLGFAVVMVAFVGLGWSFTRSMRVARSVVSKLYEQCHCPACGRALIIDTCTYCAANATK